MQQKLISTMAAKCTCKSTCMQVNLVLYTIPTFLWSQFAYLELTFVVKLKTCLARTSAIYSTLRSNFPSFSEDLKIKKGEKVTCMSTFTSPIKTKDDHKIKSFKQKVLSLSYIITCGSFLKKNMHTANQHHLTC